MRISNSGLRFEDLETFVAVVEAGAMSRAATRLSISKSVVSQRIANLESVVGERLLQRSTRSLGATDAGAAFYDRAVRILDELREATDSVTAHATRLAGPLRLAAPMSFGIRHLGPVLYQFAADHPEVQLKVELDDRFADLVREGYDMGLRIGRLQDSSLIARKLTESRRVVVGSPAYAERHDLPTELADLENHWVIKYGERSVGQQWRFATGGAEQTVQPQICFEANNGEVQRDAAIQGLGLALLPTFLCAEAVERGQLRTIRLADARPLPEPIHVVFPQNRHLSNKARALADYLFDAFGGTPYWDRPFAFDG